MNNEHQDCCLHKTCSSPAHKNVKNEHQDCCLHKNVVHRPRNSQVTHIQPHVTNGLTGQTHTTIDQTHTTIFEDTCLIRVLHTVRPCDLYPSLFDSKKTTTGHDTHSTARTRHPPQHHGTTHTQHHHHTTPTAPHGRGRGGEEGREERRREEWG